MTWDFTPELEETILDHLQNGISLVKICQMPGMPSRRTVLKWQSENEEFCAKCVRAREFQGEHAAETLDDINSKVENGELDPAAARVISSNLMWKASKLYSKRYGDKLDLNHSGSLASTPDSQLDARITDILGKAGIAPAAGGEGKEEA